MDEQVKSRALSGVNELVKKAKQEYEAQHADILALLHEIEIQETHDYRQYVKALAALRWMEHVCDRLHHFLTLQAVMGEKDAKLAIIHSNMYEQIAKIVSDESS